LPASSPTAAPDALYELVQAVFAAGDQRDVGAVVGE
jgi:hypothetical protein